MDGYDEIRSTSGHALYHICLDERLGLLIAPNLLEEMANSSKLIQRSPTILSSSHAKMCRYNRNEGPACASPEMVKDRR